MPNRYYSRVNPKDHESEWKGKDKSDQISGQGEPNNRKFKNTPAEQQGNKA